MSRTHPWLVDPVVRCQLAAVEQRITAAACRGGPCPEFHMQLLSPRSKRLRPALLLLAARFGPESPESVLVAAAAGIELLHEATLYHDDIVDEAPFRRGASSVQAACGSAAAAFAGSELLFRTGELFADLSAELRRSVGRTGEALCRGQLRELETLGDLEMTVRERVRIMRDKTGRLFSLAAHVGAGLAAAPDRVRRRLRRLGLLFGLCFQLADDIRDIMGSPGALGRSPHADLRDGVYTLPVLYALTAPVREAQELRACLIQMRSAQADPRTVTRCLALVRRAGGIGHSLATLDAWGRTARAELVRVALSYAQPSVQSLDAMLRQLRRDSLAQSTSAGPERLSRGAA